jgi:hypothetical protein
VAAAIEFAIRFDREDAVKEARVVPPLFLSVGVIPVTGVVE